MEADGHMTVILSRTTLVVQTRDLQVDDVSVSKSIRTF